MWHIASVSFGKDSIAMLLEIIKRGLPLDEVIFYDTGMEFEATYNMRDRAVCLLKQYNIKYTELTPSYSFLYKMFDKPVIRNSERSCDLCLHYKLLSLSWGFCNNPDSKFYKKHDEDGSGYRPKNHHTAKGVAGSWSWKTMLTESTVTAGAVGVAVGVQRTSCKPLTSMQKAKRPLCMSA